MSTCRLVFFIRLFLFLDVYNILVDYSTNAEVMFLKNFYWTCDETLFIFTFLTNLLFLTELFFSYKTFIYFMAKHFIWQNLIWQKFIWGTSFGETLFGKTSFSMDWLRQYFPGFARFSTGYANAIFGKQTRTQTKVEKYYIDNKKIYCYIIMIIRCLR